MDSVKPGKLWDENKSVGGFQFYHFLFNQGGEERVNVIMNEIFKLHTVNILNPVIDSTYAFEEVRASFVTSRSRLQPYWVLPIPAIVHKRREGIAERSGNLTAGLRRRRSSVLNL